MYTTLKLAIEAAKKLDYPSVIARDHTTEIDNFKVLKIKETSICSEESDCYGVAWNNKCIAIAVCSGRKYDGEINYCDL